MAKLSTKAVSVTESAANGYEVAIESITIGTRAFSIRGLKDNQQFFDPDNICKKAGICDASWSIFGHVWPSGIMLADVIDRYPLTGLRVLEVGCGLGLASLVSHHHGADITATDYHPDAAKFMDENLLLNQLLPIKFECVDWKTLNNSLGKFDLIIGSDVLYDPNHPKLLAGFIDRHADHDCTVLIVDPGRRQRLEFSKRMVINGFALTPHPLNHVLADSLEFKGRVLEYSRA